MPLRLATPARNAAADAVIGLLDAGATGGTIKIYSGGQPATPETAPTGTLLATVNLAKPTSTAASGGTDTILDPSPVTAVATGTAGWARFADANGATVMDCDVTATGGGGNLTLSSVNLSAGITVDMAAITYTVPV